MGLVIEKFLKLIRPSERDTPLWSIASKYTWTIPVVAFLSFLASALEGFGISLLVPLLSLLISGDRLSLPPPWPNLVDHIDLGDTQSTLLLFGGVIFAAVVLTSIIQAIRDAFISYIDGRAGHEIRCALSASLQRRSYSFFLKNEPAHLVSIVSNDAWRTSDSLRNRFNILGAIASTLVFSIILLAINWALTVSVVCGVLLIRWSQSAVVRRIAELSEHVSSSNRKLADRMIQAVDSIRPVRIFGQQALEHGFFVKASNDVQKSLFRIEIWAAFSAGGLRIAHAALFITILLGAYFAKVDLPSLATFMVLLYRLQPYLQQLSGARLTLAATEASVREVNWMLKEGKADDEPTGHLPFKALDSSIIFRNVTFEYPNSDRKIPALKNATLEIEKGRTTALIGRSGSGKSTIVNLLCRLLEPTDGQIIVTGKPLSEFSMRDWRARIGLAGQDIDLIDGSIRANIAYGKEDATQEEIEEASKSADIHEFIQSLPAGYSTEVGTRGLALSGGQRQRIGLARAFIRRPDLLILDEATNAVDGLSEAAILAFMKERHWSPTTIVVSHRVATLAHCDVGIVLDQGRVLEAGALHELDAFRRMLTAPFDRSEEASG